MLKNLLILFIPFLIISCNNLEKEIDLHLPVYQNRLVVECYLEPGQPFRLTLSESVSYFAPPQAPTVDNALVIITHNGIKDTLKFEPYMDIVTGKFYNYVSASIVPVDYTSIFSLYVKDTKGREATGQTTIPPPPVINSIEFFYSEDSLVYAMTKFDDISNTNSNFYRYVITYNDIQGPETVDYILNDRIKTSSGISVSSAYKLKKDDNIIVSVYHLNEDYYRFLESVGEAIDANGNPFGQPVSIKSNIQGGIGIFTGLNYDREELIVK
jgi:hypothetical protein